MTKLTLPIEIGKRYVRRDGVVVTAQNAHLHFSDLTCWVGIESTPTQYACDHVWLHSGRADGLNQCGTPADIIADADDVPALYQPAAYAAVLQMIIDGKQLQFNAFPTQDDWTDTSHGSCLTDISTLTIDPARWRVKVEPFIVNGITLAERPMSALPEFGQTYWYVDFMAACPVLSEVWDDCKFEHQILMRGLVYNTKAGATAYCNAVLKYV